ncbi:MAG: FUSC family protein [Thiobacillaceae bacterium]
MITRFWPRLRQHRVRLELSFRVTVAALLSLAIAQFFSLPLPLWAVLTAIMVTQMSIGRSLKVMIDYLAGTVSGAAYATIVAMLVPHSSEVMLLLVLPIALGPLALIAAINPRLNVAPITAVIVILVPTFTQVSPVASAYDRVLEVALGGLTGLVVSFFIFPSKVQHLVITTAAHTLDEMTEAFGKLLAGLHHGLDTESLHRIQDPIGQAIAELDKTGKEAESERSARLAKEPDTRPLLRTLLRLRHDLVMFGRVSLTPFPDSFWTRLQLPLARLSPFAAQIGDFRVDR